MKSHAVSTVLLFAVLAVATRLESANAFLPLPFLSRSSSPMVQHIPFEPIAAPTKVAVPATTTRLAARKKRKKKKKKSGNARAEPEFDITYRFGNGPKAATTTLEKPMPVVPTEQQQPELVEALELGDAIDTAKAKAEREEEARKRAQAEEEAARIRAEEEEAERLEAEAKAAELKAEQEEADRRRKMEEEAVGAFKGLPYHVIEARKQPKSPWQEAKLKDKYAAIEDVGERAFAILVDLYMIELHED